MREIDRQLRIDELKNNGYMGAPEAVIYNFKERADGVRRACNIILSAPLPRVWPDDCDW